MFLWEQPGWPRFRWQASRLLEPLAMVRFKQGRLLGGMARLGANLSLDAQIEALTATAVKSAEIEGEVLDPSRVRSSVAYRLGLAPAATSVDRQTDDFVAMTLDATDNFRAPLTARRLFGWQAALFPSGFSGPNRVKTGAWRDDLDGPMQVVSGQAGHRRVHFQPPPAQRLEAEIRQFLDWFGRTDEPEGLLRAGLAHLWFVTIHPFEDGNGRVARAVTDLALAQSEGSGQRFYSLSSQIRQERQDYYEMLEQTQKGGLDVTDWLLWFLGCFSRAIEAAEVAGAPLTQKADVWRRYAREPVTERQMNVLNQLMAETGREVTAKRWAALGQCSVPTAQRDINDLLARGILRRNPGGSKNTSYEISAL